MTTVLEIQDYCIDDGILSVSAVIDEVLLARGFSYLEPEEYKPAICSAEYELEEGQIFPENTADQIRFLEELDLDWIIEDLE